MLGSNLLLLLLKYIDLLLKNKLFNYQPVSPYPGLG